MNARLVKGYVFITVSAIVLGAAAILLLTNFDNDWTLKVIWRDRTLPRAAWLLMAAAGGVVIWWVAWKILPKGIAALRAGSIARRSRETAERLSELVKNRQQNGVRQK